MLYIEEIPAKPKEQAKLRVAAYARVSSDKDAAFHSLEAQTAYYEEYISNHSGWELVGLYSDNGISGTTINRPEFQRMLKDCRAGKIDLVVTKSVTRFARNTVTLLETIRELKALGIDCYFEKENMHSISPDGELLLTLLAMYAEEEARSASENQKWRIQKLYDQGKPASGRTFGYQRVGDTFIIVPDEAEVIRQIFSLYLSGMGYAKIAKTLTSEKALSPFQKGWSNTAVRSVLMNEKYAGDLILQKFYTEDFRTKKRRRNTGELRKVLVRNNHAPIIDRATVDAVQCEMASRGNRQSVIMEHRIVTHDNNEKLFKSLITCGDCGSKFVRKYTNAKTSDKPIWICMKYHKYGTAACRSQKIPESILIEKTSMVLGVNQLSQESIKEKVARILVPEHNHLIYEMKDGSIADVPWKNQSRSLSWTPEMRQAAREKALKRYGKEIK